MRFILRLAGTWTLGLALILLIIDGTRSLAAGALLFTPLRESWAGLHEASLSALLAGAGEGPLAFAHEIALRLLDLPGWAVLGALGALLVVLGKVRRRRSYTQVG